MFANEGRQIFHARQALAGSERPPHRLANWLLHRIEFYLHGTELRRDPVCSQLAVLHQRARGITRKTVVGGFWLSQAEQLKFIHHIDQLSESAVLSSIEAKRNSRQLNGIMTFFLFRGGLNDADLPTEDDVRKFFVQSLNRSRRRRATQADDI